MNEQPHWTNGAPCNLAAAATDALEWLRVMQARYADDLAQYGCTERLARCIAALEKELTQQEAQP